ncbi:hypothetical protein, partial [Streptomyces sp. NPDC059949]|uniref:hypothetical protein n=1 Tax=Streptomyces sp. NPDC059949 TaxID=3347013 RepID=UPI00366698A6
MSEASEPVGVILAVDRARFAEVVGALRRAGLTVTGEQPTVGTLSGTVAEDRIAALAGGGGGRAAEPGPKKTHTPPATPPPGGGARGGRGEAYGDSR